MPNAVSGNVHNLNESRAQALRALERVSDRLGEVLGDLPEDGTHRNENGELVNEDGLPIIDITEPIDDLDTPSLSAATQEDESMEDHYPEPISMLSPEALAISRQHRDKILDLLEEEEAREARRTRKEQQERQTELREAARHAMEKRMATQRIELEKRRKAKELEQKMAKALVSDLGTPEHAIRDEVHVKSSNKKNKRVTFAEPPSEPIKHMETNVRPGGLSKEKILATSAQSHPMKMEVVEKPPLPRHSQPVPTVPPPDMPIFVNKAGDSDDESDIDGDSDTTLSLESGEEDVVLSAHRHRELALEYHRRRENLAFGAGAVQLEEIATDNESNVDPNSWDKENVPLEATLAHPPPKSRISKFKAAHANAKSDSTSSQPRELSGTSPEPRAANSSSTFGTSVLPHDALAKGIKMGKLIDGRLVAGDEDEEKAEQEAREEEQIRKLLLKSMEDYSSVATQVMSSTIPPKQPQLPNKAKPAVSRFKVNRAQLRGSSEATTSVSAATAAPMANADVASSTSTPLQRTAAEPSSASAQDSYSSVQYGIVESPSFQSLPSVPTLIESPSFGPPTPVSQGPIEPQASGKTQGFNSSPPPRLTEAQQPMAMADKVIERTTVNRGSMPSDTDAKPRRVSRFKAERSGG